MMQTPTTEAFALKETFPRLGGTRIGDSLPLNDSCNPYVEVQNGTIRLEDRNGKEVKGVLLLAIWFGTQVNEAFPSAYITKSANAPGTDDGLLSIRSKVYTSPSLWYLRVNLIESQCLEKSDNGRLVKAVLGNQALTTKISIGKSDSNPVWDEELMFVVAEPFEERWKNGFVENENKIHVRICLEGGYHVVDEYEHFSGDLRAIANEQWKAKVGILDLGILGVRELLPMKLRDGQETKDAYCVAKY
ncbi:hypothetical protein LguiB_033512 [Lonicera macranthoides]